MPAGPARNEISDTYPNPDNATARTGFGKLWDCLFGTGGLFNANGVMLDNHIAFKNYGGDTFHNGSLTASVAANALTIALKTAAGANPSTTDPVLVAFRNATIGTGTVTLLAVTSALSIVIPSGATMGQSNAVAARLWVALINNAGTVELAAINTQTTTGIHPVNESSLISTTALGTGSDNAGVWYSTSARANVAMRLAGYIESTQATAGTWATTPSVIQTMGPGVRKPGEVVQVAQTATGAVATGTTLMPTDDTIPQITEGDEYMTQAITPTSAINRLEIESQAHISSSVLGASLATAIFQDATASAVAATFTTNTTAGDINSAIVRHTKAAGTTSSTTFRVRSGASTAGTTTFNGTGGGRRLGGVMASYIKVTEVMT